MPKKYGGSPISSGKSRAERRAMLFQIRTCAWYREKCVNNLHLLGAFQILSCTWWREKAILAAHQFANFVQVCCSILWTWTFYNFPSLAREDTHKPVVLTWAGSRILHERAIWITSKSTLTPWRMLTTRWQSKMFVLKFCKMERFGAHD